MADDNILRTTQSRVFMTESASSPAVQPIFQACMVLQGITQSFGDREAIYCQDPYRIGKFKTIGFTESPTEPVETSLNARFPYDTRSTLVRAARSQAKIDVHVHMGAVGANPQVFNGWRKKIVFEGARLSSLDIDEVGSHDEDTPVSHSVDITADDWYEIVPPAFSERGTNVATLPVTDVALFYNGRVELPPRERVIALAVSAPSAGSPATSSDLLYSLDQGTTWYAADIATMFTQAATGVAVVGDYVAVVGGGATAYGIHFTRWGDLNTVTVPTFTRSSVGFVASKLPRDIHSLGSIAFIAADGGYVYRVTDAPSGVSVMSGGTATTNNLTAISAYSENVIVAVGASNTVLVCLDGENFATVTGPSVGNDLTAVATLSPTTFLVGTDEGRLFYTTNAGVSWQEKSFQGSAATGATIHDIAFANSLIGYMSVSATGAASLLMTTDGGYSWDAMPRGGVLSYTTGYASLAAMRDDPNIVLAGGPDESGTGGSILMGEALD